MKKILFVDRIQLGLTTDCVKYCEYLKNEYQIHFICFNSGKEKVRIPNIKVTYIPKIGNKVMRASIFLLYVTFYILFFNGFIFIFNFPKCSILKRILFWKKMHIDIRTLSVSKNATERMIYDLQLEKDVSYFDSSSFISQGIQKKISIPKEKKSFILPLGSDILSDTDKAFNSIQLLYVGTLTNRNIIDTIKGYVEFIKSHPHISTHYDIIGDGENNELSEMNEYIKKVNMEKYVTLHGRLPYSALKPFFHSHNVGVSYIPITDYFEYQPPTKTFEYILSGMVCLATSTKANEEVITTKNGILHKDNSMAFKEALEIILQKQDTYNSNTIRNTLLDYQWKNIIEKYLKPIINQ